MGDKRELDDQDAHGWHEDAASIPQLLSGVLRLLRPGGDPPL